MYTLGVSQGHNCSVCLLRNEQVLFHLENEKYVGIKNDKNEFPIDVLIHILKYTDFIDNIVLVQKSDNGLDCVVDYLSLKNIVSSDTKIFKFVRKYHHVFHAINSAYGSGFENAVCIVTDGSGAYHDGFGLERESIFYFDGDRVETVKQWYQEVNNYEGDVRGISVGKAFGALRLTNDAINIGADESGKLMGLAPYGNPNPKIPDFFIMKNGKYESNPEMLTISPINKRQCVTDPNFLSQFKIEDLAYKLQLDTYKVVKQLVEISVEETKCSKVCLSGGYFYNVVTNYRLVKDFPNLTFYPDPISGDVGLSMGASKFIVNEIINKKEKIQSLYLGL